MAGTEQPTMMEGLQQALDEANGIFDQLIEVVRAKVKEAQETNVVDLVLDFIHAVDWTEPWLIGLLSFHVILLITAIATRKRNNTQSILFFGILIAVFLAEPLNSLGAKHWQKFARQKYFDSHGFFISTVYSGPLVLIVCIVLVNLLIATVDLLVTAKRAELRRSLRRRREAPQTNEHEDKKER